MAKLTPEQVQGKSLSQLERLKKAFKKDEETLELIEQQIQSLGKEPKKSSKKSSKKKSKKEGSAKKTAKPAKKAEKKDTKKVPEKTKREKPKERTFDEIAGYSELPSGMKVTEINKVAKKVTSEYEMPIENVQVREHFNKRIDYGDIPMLAQSIQSSGLRNPISGDMVEIDGKPKFVITDGHRRWAAIQMLIESGHDWKSIPVRVNDKNTTEESRIFDMFLMNDGLPLSPLENAELAKLLINMGWKPKEIAAKIGKSVATISTWLKLSDADQATKNAVKAGEISATKAVNEKRKKRAKTAYQLSVVYRDAEDEDQNFNYSVMSKGNAAAAKRVLIAYMEQIEADHDGVIVNEVKE